MIFSNTSFSSSSISLKSSSLTSRFSNNPDRYCFLELTFDCVIGGLGLTAAF